MLDYIKGLITENSVCETLFNNSHLKDVKFTTNFPNEIDLKKETKTRFIKEYKGVFIAFYFKNDEFTKVELLIKPHYYYNDNKHNANDFKVYECIKVLKEIIGVLNINPKFVKIINIEFGLNFSSPIESTDFIGYLVYHERNKFISSNEGLAHSKISYKVSKKGMSNNYKMIKFYAKDIQYPNFTEINTLRFEIKSKKSRYINKLGIYNLNDLLFVNLYKVLINKLKEEFKQILIVEYKTFYENEILTKKEILNLADYTNPYYWEKLLNKKSRNVFSNHKKKYFQLLNKTGDNIHNKTFEIICKKLNELLE